MPSKAPTPTSTASIDLARAVSLEAPQSHRPASLEVVEPHPVSQQGL